MDSKSELITGGIDGCFILQFTLISKYNVKQALRLDPEGHNISFSIETKGHLAHSPLWVKGLNIDETNDLIICWSQEFIVFYDLASGDMIYKYAGICTSENYCSDIILSLQYHYFICGYHNGTINVFKLLKKPTLLHSFNAHLKAVTSLRFHDENTRLLLSTGLDSKIKLWSLIVCTNIYIYIYK